MLEPGRHALPVHAGQLRGGAAPQQDEPPVRGPGLRCQCAQRGAGGVGQACPSTAPTSMCGAGIARLLVLALLYARSRRPLDAMVSYLAIGVARSVTFRYSESRMHSQRLIFSVVCLTSCTPAGPLSTTGGHEAGSTGHDISTTKSVEPTDGGSSSSASPEMTTDANATNGSSTTNDPSSTDGTSSDATTGSPAGECRYDSDCELSDDCCNCGAVPSGENGPSCDIQKCSNSKCSELGIDRALCRLGVCRTERLSCNGMKVFCDMPPPRCENGFLPETSPECWTGRCVPIEYCDNVPHCGFCLEGQMCIEITGEGSGDWPICEPVPPVCNGVVSCDCIEPFVCSAPFTSCSSKGQTVHCKCPDC